jgi:FkbM family methyltransferase
MARARRWIGGVFLRAPASLRSAHRWPVVGSWIHRLSHAILPPGEYHWAQVKAGPARGLWLELNPRTGQSYLNGAAEEHVQNTLAKHLSRGMVFYDLGANIGFFSLLAARIVGPEGHVFSFEPDATVAVRLRRNVSQNGFSNVTVIEKGAWSSNRRGSFAAAESASPDRGTGRFVASQRDGTALVECVALDDFAAAHSAPDAIKCDVEGAEIEVLRGAENLIRRNRPWILGEMHSDANARAWVEWLTRFGYNLETLDANHILACPNKSS